METPPPIPEDATPKRKRRWPAAVVAVFVLLAVIGWAQDEPVEDAPEPTAIEAESGRGVKEDDVEVEEDDEDTSADEDVEPDDEPEEPAESDADERFREAAAYAGDELVWAGEDIAAGDIGAAREALAFAREAVEVTEPDDPALQAERERLLESIRGIEAAMDDAQACAEGDLDACDAADEAIEDAIG